jgi:hypothetical protein
MLAKKTTCLLINTHTQTDTCAGCGRPVLAVQLLQRRLYARDARLHSHASETRERRVERDDMTCAPGTCAAHVYPAPPALACRNYWLLQGNCLPSCSPSSCRAAAAAAARCAVAFSTGRAGSVSGLRRRVVRLASVAGHVHEDGASALRPGAREHARAAQHESMHHLHRY